jgi:hypothetical protein
LGLTKTIWTQPKQFGQSKIILDLMLNIDFSKPKSCYPRYPYRQTLVCNYHPPGNHLGKPVYLIGEAGSACSDDVSKGNKNGGLCP